MTDGWEIKEELDHVVDAVIESGGVRSEPTTVVDCSEGAPEVVRAWARATRALRGLTPALVGDALGAGWRARRAPGARHSA